MKKAILTGFEPFGLYKYNPVQDVAKEYDGKVIGDIEVTGLVLPCTYYGAFDLLSKKIDNLFPEVILGSGLASKVQCIRLEGIGRNIMGGKYADADGRKPENEPLIQGGRLWYPTNSDNISLANALYEAGVPSEISVDAEGFICNSLIYLTAKRIFEEKLPIKFAFFHTPWLEEYLDRIHLEPGKVTITKRDLKKTIEVLINELR